MSAAMSYNLSPLPQPSNIAVQKRASSLLMITTMRLHFTFLLSAVRRSLENLVKTHMCVAMRCWDLHDHDSDFGVSLSSVGAWSLQYNFNVRCTWRWFLLVRGEEAVVHLNRGRECSSNPSRLSRVICAQTRGEFPQSTCFSFKVLKSC